MNTTKQSARREEWQSIVDKQEQSGLSQTEYCKQNNLALSQFTYYRGIIKASERATPAKLDTFSPIKINKPVQNPSPDIRILLPNGFQCFIPSQVDAPHIKRLMEMLLSC
jgi:hypothetical protein